MFRFTIRELVLLTLVVAMGVGWWADRSTATAEARLWKARAEYVAESLRYPKGDVYFQDWDGDRANLNFPQQP